MTSKIILLMLILVSPLAWSHKSSDSFVNLKVNNETITGRWDIALRDLEYALTLDVDNDGTIIWSELRTRFQEIESYVFARFQVKNGSKECIRQTGPLQVDRHSDGVYAVLNFNLDCSKLVDQLAVEYQLLFDLDSSHRGLVQISKGESREFVVFSPENQQADIDFSQSNQWQTFCQFLTEGVWHIWIGYYHILFLLCLVIAGGNQKNARGLGAK